MSKNMRSGNGLPDHYGFPSMFDNGSSVDIFTDELPMCDVLEDLKMEDVENLWKQMKRDSMIANGSSVNLSTEEAENLWGQMGEDNGSTARLPVPPPTILVTGDDGLLFTTEANAMRNLENGRVSVSFSVVPSKMPKRVQNVEVYVVNTNMHDDNVALVIVQIYQKSMRRLFGLLANGRSFKTKLRIDNETTRSFQTSQHFM